MSVVGDLGLLRTRGETNDFVFYGDVAPTMFIHKG